MGYRATGRGAWFFGVSRVDILLFIAFGNENEGILRDILFILKKDVLKAGVARRVLDDEVYVALAEKAYPAEAALAGVARDIDDRFLIVHDRFHGALEIPIGAPREFVYTVRRKDIAHPARRYLLHEDKALLAQALQEDVRHAER